MLERNPADEREATRDARQAPHRPDVGGPRDGVETDSAEREEVAVKVLILQADRLGSGNMRSMALDVFPDARVTIVSTAADAISAIQDNRYKLAILGLAAADLVWMDDFPQILTLLRSTPTLVISGRHAPRTFRLLNQIRSVSIFDPVTEGPMELRAALGAIVGGCRYLSPSASLPSACFTM